MLKGVTFRSTLVVSACAVALSAHAVADTPRKVDAPAGELTVALRSLAEATGVEFVYSAKQLKGVRTQGVRGDYTIDEAVHKLLEGTKPKLTTVHQSGALLISDLNFPGATSFLSESEATAGSGIREDGSTGEAAGNGIIRVAQTDQGANPNPAATSAADSSSTESAAGRNANSFSSKLEEVIVTAQKREERLQDVPVPVTAISAATLSDRNQTHLQDYYSSVPGLNFTTHENGGADIAIRGITTGSSVNPSNPTVSFVVDDVPFGSSSSAGGGRYFPDIDPSELERIEILRGPQGTLYGASSVGGLVKLVTVDPSTREFSGQAQVDVNGVSNGDGPGYGGRAAVNVPVSDTFAIRASGFGRRDTGYIDNAQTAQRGVNWGSAGGGRLSTLWRPSDTFSLKLSALVQTLDRHGSSVVDLGTGLGDLQQNHHPGTGWNHVGTQAYSAIAKAQLGAVDLTFLSGYNINSDTNNFDATPVLRGIPGLPDFPGIPFVFSNKTKKLTEELRLAVPLGQNVDWLVGAFYTDEDSDNKTRQLVANEAGQVVDAFGLADNPSSYREIAGFTNVTVRFTERFDTQFGARASRITQRTEEIDTGLWSEISNGVDPYILSPQKVTANAFTYLVTPRFRVSSDLMVYGRLASGYRAGGFNTNFEAIGVSDHFDPDKTLNYELGVKGNLLDGALSFDASVYYIDWKDVQISVTPPQDTTLSYTANAGRAKSQGVELALESRPAEGLAVSGWIAWNDAVLTKDFPPGGLYGVSGDRLPNSSRLSGSLSLRQEFPLGSATAFAGVSASYVGDRQGVFLQPPPDVPVRQKYSAYVKTDLDVGAKYDTWMFTLYANNVTNRRAIVDGGIGYTNPVEFGVLPPRMIGLSMTKSF